MTPPNDEGVTRDVVKYWHERVRFLDNVAYAQLDLATRGLYHSLRYLACAQGHLPNDPAILGCLSRLDAQQVADALPRLLRSGLFLQTEDGASIYCPAAEEHAAEVIATTVQRIKKGREAAQRQWEKKRKAEEDSF